MPRAPTGQIIYRDGFPPAVRITIIGQRRALVELSGAGKGEEHERGALIAEQAARIRKAGKAGTEAAKTLLDELGRARAGGLSEVLQVIGEMCDGVSFHKAKPDAAATRGPTFREVATEWTSGKLAQRFPGKVETVSESWNATNENRLTKAVFPVIGNKRVRELTRANCEEVMRRLPIPKGKKTLARWTLRQYAMLLVRVLNLAELAGYIDRSPLPAKWSPKAPNQREKRFPILYPAEDLQLMRCKEVALCYRLVWGFMHREGMRREEAAKLQWRDVDLTLGTVSLDENKTDHPRWWKLGPGVAEALTAWKRIRGDVEDTDRVFVDEHERPLTLAEMTRRVLGHLKAAGLERHDLDSAGPNKGPFGTHCFRRSFVTRSLANGVSEDWVRQRTGHTSSQLLGYRQPAISLAELALGELEPLSLAIPELNDGPGQAVRKVEPNPEPEVRDGCAVGSDSDRDSDRKPREGGGTGRRTSLRCGDSDSEIAGNPERSGGQCDRSRPFGNPDSESDPNPGDPVEVALTEAIRLASAAGRWDVVGTLAAELQARRVARAGVVSLGDERRRRDRS